MLDVWASGRHQSERNVGRPYKSGSRHLRIYDMGLSDDQGEGRRAGDAECCTCFKSGSRHLCCRCDNKLPV